MVRKDSFHSILFYLTAILYFMMAPDLALASPIHPSIYSEMAARGEPSTMECPSGVGDNRYGSIPLVVVT